MTSSASASSSPTGPCRLSHFSVEASFCTRPFSSCTTTVASVPTSSDTFPTPSVVDDGFYTCSLASSLLQPLFSLPRVPVRATAHHLLVLCREGITNSFSLSNDSKSPPRRLPLCEAVAVGRLLFCKAAISISRQKQSIASIGRKGSTPSLQRLPHLLLRQLLCLLPTPPTPIIAAAIATLVGHNHCPLLRPPSPQPQPQPHPHLPPFVAAAHLPNSATVPCYSPHRSLPQHSLSPATIVASPATQLLPSPSAATLLVVDLPYSRPALSNSSERPTLYSSTMFLVVAAFLLLNRSRSHSRRPYLYCRCILFFPSSTVRRKQRTLCSFYRSQKKPQTPFPLFQPSLRSAGRGDFLHHPSTQIYDHSGPGQIARLHRVRPCVAAASAWRTATCLAASPPSAEPRGRCLLWLPFLLFISIASLADALQSVAGFFCGRSSTSSTVLAPLPRVTGPPFQPPGPHRHLGCSLPPDRPLDRLDAASGYDIFNVGGHLLSPSCGHSSSSFGGVDPPPPLRYSAGDRGLYASDLSRFKISSHLCIKLGQTLRSEIEQPMLTIAGSDLRPTAPSLADFAESSGPHPFVAFCRALQQSVSRSSVAKPTVVAILANRSFAVQR
ncbi:hypothetical protein BHE74_00027844 [Ensete ventricosum]|nr:hypothetical protein BHE74_00027844 [Ensete ventricosum]